MCLPASLRAQEDTKAPFDKSKAQEGGLGMPTPFDKFLALDQTIPEGKVDWPAVFRKVAVDLDPDGFTDAEVAIPMALGIRIADGVMAIKARDAELLNNCASDIEKLAQKMGVSDADLGRARAVRAAANKGDWLKVFMELGFFQQDIMKKIEDKENTSRGTLLIVSGWMQGARHTATVIEEHYSAEVSNILREPMLAKALKEKVASLPEPLKKNPLVVRLGEVLPAIETILDIPTSGEIPKEKVSELKKLATDVVKAVAAAAD